MYYPPSSASLWTLLSSVGSYSEMRMLYYYFSAKGEKLHLCVVIMNVAMIDRPGRAKAVPAIQIKRLIYSNII